MRRATEKVDSEVTKLEADKKTQVEIYYDVHCRLCSSIH
jgi:hypothetical protein